MRSTREWFISRNGQVQGPFSTASIRERLAQGEVTPLDQICQAGGASDLQWKLIFECPEFIQPASAPGTSASANGAAEWVLLRQTTTGQFSLKRSGPYTTDDLALMLREGSINFSDYVWKKGFQRWAQLETLREFNHSLPAEHPKLELVQGRMPAPLEIPAPIADEPPDIPKAITQDELNILRAARTVGQRESIETRSSELEPTPVWMRAGIASLIALGVMMGLASLRSAKKHHQAQNASRSLVSREPAVADGEGHLAIIPLDMDVHPKLEFDMSAPAKTFVKVQITGEEGQILHRMRFEQTVSLQKKGHEAPVLDLTPLGLPDGTYEVTADDGNVTTQQQIFVGTHDNKFDRELVAHRDEIAKEQLTERRAVYDMAGRLSKLVDQLQPPGRGSASDSEAHYALWMGDFQKLMRSASLDQAASQSAEPALLQAAQGLAKSVREQAEASASGSIAPSEQTTALKNQIRRLQIQASGSKK